MREEIYDYEGKLQRYRRIIAGFGGNGEVALRFLDHLFSLGLSTARVSKVASHVPALLRLIDFSLKGTTRSDVERVVAAINGNRRWSAWTKHDKKLILRKLVQYAKHGSCDRGAPLPPEVAWIKLNVRGEDRVTPEALLTREDFEALARPEPQGRKAQLQALPPDNSLIIKRLARKAGLRKAVWPYLFRHTTLTALAKVFTEARLEQFAGSLRMMEQQYFCFY